MMWHLVSPISFMDISLLLRYMHNMCALVRSMFFQDIMTFASPQIKVLSVDRERLMKAWKMSNSMMQKCLPLLVERVDYNQWWPARYHTPEIVHIGCTATASVAVSLGPQQWQSSDRIWWRKDHVIGPPSLPSWLFCSWALCACPGRFRGKEADSFCNPNY